MECNIPPLVFAEESLYAQLQKIEDTRKKRGIRYTVASVLLFILLGKLCGQNTPSAIADWVQHRQELLCQALGLDYLRMPHHSTYRRILALFGLSVEQELSTFLQCLAAQTPYEIMVVDGKTLRGTLTPADPFGLHLLTAYLPEVNIALKQLPVDKTKENEIVVAPQLVADLTLTGKVLIGDAMHTQRSLSQQALDQHGHFAWIAKDNQKQIRQAIELLFAPPPAPLPGHGCPPPDFRSATTRAKQHGRLEERTLTASGLLNEYLDWPGVAQVFKVERRFTYPRTGKTYHEVQYGLTSLTATQATPHRLLEILRCEWGIENSLHYRRDVTFREDHTKMKHHPAARGLAMIHNVVIALLGQKGFTNHAQAQRAFDAHPLQAVSLLLGL